MKNMHVNTRVTFVLAGLFVLLAVLPVWGEMVRCATCGRRITGKYVRVEEKAYCSSRCLEQSLPRCATCGKRVQGPHPVLEDKHYCSRRCMESAMPACDLCGTPLYSGFTVGDHRYCERCAKLPRCDRCGLPFREGMALGDGRRICGDCNRGLIFTAKQADTPYMIARHELFRVTSYRSPSVPTLSVVGLDQLRKLGNWQGDPNMVQRGIYRREVTVTRITGLFGRSRETVDRIKEDVFILSGLSRPEFIATAVHELTHDLLNEKYPEIAEKAPNWVEEGLCQYVSASACLLNGYFEELDKIEKAPDAEYGDGYRYFWDKFGDADWEEVAEWLDGVKVSSLPAAAPSGRP